MSVVDDVHVVENGYQHGLYFNSYGYDVTSYSETTATFNGIPTYSGVATGFATSYVQVIPVHINTADFDDPGVVRFNAFDNRTAEMIHGTSADGKILFTTTIGTDASGNPYTTLHAFSGSPIDPSAVIAYSSENPFCLAEGTMIATPDREVAVEELAVGDQVLTADGRVAPVTWIGRREFVCRFYPRTEHVMPITIDADALSSGIPNRPLRVSPGHGVAMTCFDRMLVPAVGLINGATIRQDAVDRVTYFHVELDRHDLLLANGVPVESYLDVGNRAAFATDALPSDQSPDPLGDVASCLPRVWDTEVHAGLRVHLQERARALGWCIQPVEPAIRLAVGDEEIVPDLTSGRASFLVPASASSAILRSSVFQPSLIESCSTDNRKLGMLITAIFIDDGCGDRREIPLDHFALDRGFHAVEGALQPRRWTNGAAILPAVLWEGCCDPFRLEVIYDSVATVAWMSRQAEDFARRASS